MALPRTSSRTPLRSDAPSHRAMPSESFSLPLAVMASLHPKRHRNRMTILALLALISLSTYIFCSQFSFAISPAFVLQQKPTTPEQIVLGLEPMRQARLAQAKKKQTKHSFGGREPVTLTPAQELAAVSSFIASLPQNMIPLSVDPALPIDPELVLDFDTRSPHAMEEVELVVEDVWTRNPVMLYCKLHSAVSRELKGILEDMNLRPPPMILEVDTRDDGEVLLPILSRLTGSSEIPILLIGGRPVGSMAQIREMLSTGELQRLVKSSGAVIGGGKRRKHHRK
ncbi:hypothetical protein FB45DRAFT_1051348 [Roridomyces roridus]|uniref:Glutaredoxin domain-containing protein n=1 Tax=Roridomyces roridus TaxID=1738132 RepID=A0AAD7CE78_9AGAR|nr:hypothetical protein FB45DRAFT_1051348 [Roridomyces roridus]